MDNGKIVLAWLARDLVPSQLLKCWLCRLCPQALRPTCSFSKTSLRPVQHPNSSQCLESHTKSIQQTPHVEGHLCILQVHIAHPSLPFDSSRANTQPTLQRSAAGGLIRRGWDSSSCPKKTTATYHGEKTLHRLHPTCRWRSYRLPRKRR